VGRFIENVDFRATKADTRDPAISPDMKPMLQHEFVTGVDWALNPTWTFAARYSRKRLDRTIEDMSITDNLASISETRAPSSPMFFIGPFPFLARPAWNCPNLLTFPDGSRVTLTTVPFCAECPAVAPAVRRYDGARIQREQETTAASGSAPFLYLQQN